MSIYVDDVRNLHTDKNLKPTRIKESPKQDGNGAEQTDKTVAQTDIVFSKPTRMSVSLPSDAAQMLETLATNQGISKNEALRKAIATEAYFQREISQGSTILVQKANNELREIVFR